MPTPRLAVLPVIALLTFASCVKPGSPGSGSSSSTIVMEVSGRKITAEEFIGSPPVRNAVKQFILMDTMKAECAKRGIKVDEAEVDRRIADTKKNLELSGQSWEDYLKETGVTEAEYREMLSGPMLFEALSADMTKATDEDVQKGWSDPAEQERLKTAYAAENHLPDSDKAKLTLEDAQFYEFVKNDVQAKKTMGESATIIQQFIDKVTLDLSASISDPESAKLYEDLILNNSKTKPEEAKAGDKEGVVLTPPDSAAGSGSDTEEAEASAPSSDAGDGAEPEEGSGQ